MQWLISTEDFNVVSHGFRNTLPKHKEGEVQFENGYTFEKYQGKGLFSSVHVKMFEVAKEKGFKRVIAYVRQDNIGSLKACERAGFRKFEKMSELKFLSLTKRKYGQELDLF
jgi:RimJ/RimL family protein N-acetyltransferase